MENHFTSDRIGMLILEELKLIRNELKDEVRSMRNEIISYGDKLLGIKENRVQDINMEPQYSGNCFVDINPETTPSFNTDTLENNINLEKSNLTISEENSNNFIADNIQIKQENTTEMVSLFKEYENILQPAEQVETESQSLEKYVSPVETSNEVAAMPMMMGPIVIKQEVVEELDKDITDKFFTYSVPKAITNEPYNKEPDCNQKPNNQQLVLRMELPVQIKEKDKKYKCSKCSKEFKFLSSLAAHKRSHSRNFRCDECQRGFFTNKQLQEHEETHYYKACRICGKRFSCIEGLEVHIRDHQKAGHSRKCHVCGKAFASPSLLTVHLRIHTGEKPYFCDICNHSFAQLGNLKSHIKRHKNEKKLYNCPFCNRKFLNFHLLKRHLNKCAEKQNDLLAITN